MRTVGFVLAAWALALAPACRGEPEAGELHDGWSGTPPAEPAEVGEKCDEQWVACVGGAFCDHGNQDFPGCGELGVCVAVPDTCDPDPRPVCGCDGQLYDSPCAAAMAGVGQSGAVGCAPPVGKFSCGFAFCDIATEYCKHTIGHGEPESWVCVPLDCPVDTTGCACITDPSPCGDPAWYPGQWCTDLAGGATEFTCLPA